MILPNTLRTRLDEGKPTIGTHVMFSDPDIPELIGDTGVFDYAEFSAEYSVLDSNNLYHLARAGQCGNLPLIIKLDQEAQGFWAQMAMGAGFKGVLFTDIRTPSDVAECHDCIAPDTPDKCGRMGVKLRRPALSSYDVVDYSVDLESFVFKIMIEKSVAVDDIDAILELAKDKQVDMTQWGPADFGFSLGRPEMKDTPEITPFEKLIIKKSLEYGVRPRIEIGEVEQAKPYIDLGVKDFCIGWDRFILYATFARLGEGLRGLIDDL